MAKKRQNKNPVAGVVAFYVRGTTYSGNPVRTTLGNTLRSIMYMYFYAYEAGLFDPEEWKSKPEARHIWCIASGDDVVAWLKTHQLWRLRDSLRELTTDDKDLMGIIGLGQIIVD